MNLGVLGEIKKRYENFIEIINSYKKGKLGALSSEEVKAVKDTVEDLFVLEIFSCLERFLRNQINSCLNVENCPFGGKEILKHIEYMKIEEVLDSLKDCIESDRIGYLKQIKRYRDWVAHGRNPQKPPPVRTVDFDKVFEIVETVMEQVERKSGK